MTDRNIEKTLRDWQAKVGYTFLGDAADEIARLREAKRMAGLIADERSLENVALRAEIDRLRKG